ncbi:hypothetical protein [Oryzomonas rubra]|uniref:Uncharacterized protein n=1 Tax=Oryzomonas rubra TaxID=2509454 RepID=A0A5A9X8C6_9BACT|nr:hypothetical protein [Oryzomonas rubra]KAA0888718.1 hypothetical protein ET418_15165 [Oryzomonas rubra]
MHEINCRTDCPDIGRCCRVFILNRGANYKRSIEEKTPFRVIKAEEQSCVATCKNLQADGLCSDYENRPATCWDYTPGVESLCALFVGPPKPGGMTELNPELLYMRESNTAHHSARAALEVTEGKAMPAA